MTTIRNNFPSNRPAGEISLETRVRQNWEISSEPSASSLGLATTVLTARNRLTGEHLRFIPPPYLAESFSLEDLQRWVEREIARAYPTPEESPRVPTPTPLGFPPNVLDSPWVNPYSTRQPTPDPSRPSPDITRPWWGPDTPPLSARSVFETEMPPLRPRPRENREVHIDLVVDKDTPKYPFSLSRARNGDTVVDNLGNEVTQICVFDFPKNSLNEEKNYPVYALIDRKVYKFNVNGVVHRSSGLNITLHMKYLTSEGEFE